MMEKLKETGSIIGGESSGHIICLDKTSTGDGIVAALQVLAEMQQTNSRLNELCSVITKYPQRLINIRVDAVIDLDNNDDISTAVKDAEAKLGNQGRVLLRASGTEPVIRVMVESQDAELTDQLASELANKIETILQGQ